MSSTSPASALELCFAYAGDINTPTGGYGYDRRIIAGLEALGWRVDLLPLGDTYPFPPQDVLDTAYDRLAALAPATRVVVDGLAYARLGARAAELGRHLQLTALVHHPLCLEHGLSADEAALLKSEEGAALAHAQKVIVTSPATAVLVQDLFAMPVGRIGVVEPGTDPAPAARGSGGPGVALISVGSVLPRKGHDLVVAALARLTDLDWSLRIIGGLRDADCVTSIRRQIEDLGLSNRIELVGALDSAALEHAYAAADAIVLASRYEGFGMAFAEALAHGLPVVGSGGAAVQKTFALGGALYVEPDDLDGLTDALDKVISDASLRQSLKQGALQAAAQLADWHAAAKLFSTYVE
ncbi:glycosyltransferase family 4 protein [Pannonibacter sp. SL95]|uniref:glycosyltransferase family 4 protein n=1 Tax=Pannonibacter sp. SL95 TaxID=2995153 RepID=UPI00227680FA|nr:glycosyltransferase family 4 protein [Pannonibacter sp. SL95]MCY1707058.1 glycosyltransferase family 4 protein [Pannonibacter sp. SL95]